MRFRAILKTYYPALLIALVLTLFSVYAFYQTCIVIADRRAKLFDMRVQQVKEILEKRIDDYVQILKGCQSVFYISDTVTSAEWKKYTQNLQLATAYPGILAIAYATYIPKSEIPLLEKKMKQGGFPQFRVNSPLKNNYLTPIIYIEPFRGRNLRAWGYDMFSEDTRRTAMLRAMTTGKASITKKLTLIQETNEDIQPGFLLYLPVYKDLAKTETAADRKQNIQGFVYNAFRAHDLMEAIFKNFRDIHINLFDGKSIDTTNLLYTSDSTQKAGKASEFAKTTAIVTGGTYWTVQVLSGQDFGSAIERRQPVLILAIGLSITFLLTGISVMLIKRKSDVLNELNMTKELETKKDEFIGIASHELKTPLTSIKAYLQLLERAELNFREKIFVNKANLQIYKLNKLIGDLLDVSKIQAGKLDLNISSFPLRDLIESSVENVRHIYNSHKLIKPENFPAVTISGDQFRLEQAITNLLGNAVKYSPHADKVYIRTKVVNNDVKIEIEDFGIGISEEDQKRIFDKFYRSKELSQVLSGLGMGLYIAHEIIKRHQGDISVKSETGKGTTFCICLPLAA